IYRGKEVEIPTPRAAQQLGISMIHQEMNLMPHLTVAQNVFIGREPLSFKLLVDEQKINKNTQQLMASLHLPLGPRVRVSGRTIYQTSPEIPDQASREVVLEVRNLRRGSVIRDVSFQLRRGEILGFAGLLGAGRTEVMRAVFGADPIDSGEIYVRGKRVHVK